MDKNAFGRRLAQEVARWVAADPGRTEGQLAEAVGVSGSTLSDAQRGSMPRANTLHALAVELGVSADYLLGLTDSPVPVIESDAVAALRDIADRAQEALAAQPRPAANKRKKVMPAKQVGARRDTA